MLKEVSLTKNSIIQELTKSPHGDLKQYLPTGRAAVTADPEFFAHLIAWNHRKGVIRDAKVALPVIALTHKGHDDFTQNALAHLAALDPRNLVRGLRFSKEVGSTSQRAVRRTIERYLRAREINWSWWERTAIQHRDSLKELYSLCHVKPAALANQILFKREYPAGTAFSVIKSLKTGNPTEIAGLITKHRIPWLVAIGALGVRIKEPDVLLAMIQRMTPTELVTNSKMLEKLGVKKLPALRAAYEEGLVRVGSTKKQALKTAKALEAVEDAGTKARLEAVQEKQLDAMGVKGNWLVLADKSGSMAPAIAVALEISALLARMAEGQVHLCFFDVNSRYLDVTKKSLAEIKALTNHITAAGGTSIGVGLDHILQREIEVDGIAIVSDGAENAHPRFASVYESYSKKIDKKVPVYFYKIVSTEHLMHGMTLERDMAGESMQLFDLRGGIDYHSLPNLVQTMRTNRFSLVDEIMAVPLKTVDQVLKERKHEERVEGVA